MAAEGYKKKDIQRVIQKVHTGAAISSKALDAVKTTTVVELGFPAEKVTLVTTGNLAADVVPKIGAADSNTTIAASTTPSTTTTSHLFTAVSITRTGGSGQVLILAK